MVKKITIAVVCSLALIGSARAAKVWLLGNGGAGVFGGGTYTPPTQQPSYPLVIP